MFALLAAAVVTGRAAAPLEAQSIDTLREARQNLLVGAKRGRGLAVLDSLIFADGVSVAMEAPGAMELPVARGLQAWNDALGEETFRMKPGGSAADVTVRFVPNLDGLGGDVQGMVEATRQLSWSRSDHGYRLHAVIYVRDNVDGRSLRSDEVVNVVAHEAGHLLGLADVERRDRLMGPMVVGRPKDGPLPEEVAAVRDYRTEIRRSYPRGA